MVGQEVELQFEVGGSCCGARLRGVRLAAFHPDMARLLPPPPGVGGVGAVGGALVLQQVLAVAAAATDGSGDAAAADRRLAGLGLDAVGRRLGWLPANGGDRTRVGEAADAGAASVAGGRAGPELVLGWRRFLEGLRALGGFSVYI